MKHSLTRNASLAILGIGLAATSVGAVGIVTSSLADEPERKPIESVAEAPPAPALTFQFISSEGEFRVSTWDDRALSEAQKAADPSFNPAWEPFAACLEQRGVPARAQS